jgi:hypothetical protein
MRASRRAEKAARTRGRRAAAGAEPRRPAQKRAREPPDRAGLPPFAQAAKAASYAEAHTGAPVVESPDEPGVFGIVVRGAPFEDGAPVTLLRGMEAPRSGRAAEVHQVGESYYTFVLA